MRDEQGNWLGLHNQNKHRSVGSRAWGPNSEWCYESAPCDYCLAEEHGDFGGVVDRLHAAEAERDLLAGIIRGIGGTIDPLAKPTAIWTHDWVFGRHIDGARLKPAEADAVARILGEGER